MHIVAALLKNDIFICTVYSLSMCMDDVHLIGEAFEASSLLE